jgi:hypothetical protein
MRKAVLGLVILLSFFLLGCPVTDLQPLYLPSDAVTEPALISKWIVADLKGSPTIEFQKSGDNTYSMITADPDEGLTDTYELHLVRLGGNLFADLRFSKRTHTGMDTAIDMPVGAVSAHMVVKLVIVKDDLSFSTMEDDNLKKKSATEAAPLAYLDYAPEGILVTADTAALRRYVTAHATDGFSEPEHWRRVSQ